MTSRLTALAALAVITALPGCKPAADPAAASGAQAAATVPSRAAAELAAASTETRIGDLVIRLARTRETPAAGGTGVGFLQIRNDGDRDDRLVAAGSDAAASVEIHQMSMADGQMRMRALHGGLAIPAGATVDLAPGGYHLMLVGLRQALVTGSAITLRLRFETAGEGTVVLPVTSLAP